ncbi:PQQ-dependent sugar dehydrogenase [Halomicroarcula sp. F13]|uniref:PQQ-dependent sugar dehydrogenase n=1 Tax=Haloarcula rubra TaxID=2487747 RepID=A0AAW4PSB3_9EURY|nr:PQQ-dependent sugar dehydrogenase [Halomicroarcula rubra]MBX0323054.1 PQQ-dependent sugar dehydrogenase [Halomicroarcula rubra]
MDATTRRRFLEASGLALTALAGCVDGGAGSGQSTATTENGTSDPSLDSLELLADPVATGFTSPLDVVVPRSEEYWVVDQAGQVAVVDGADADPQVALDVTDRMVDVGGYDERGLLGLAFHPEYDGAGRAYVRYSAPRREGTPDDYSHTFVLSEFEVSDRTIDPDSERTVLEIPEPQGNHNAGAVTFGPDGYLYVGVGDGGAGNDQGRGHVEDWYDAVDGGNGQDVTENLLGSILRIDVDGDGTDGRPYAVPDDNPLVGKEGLPEQFAWGFRNPWRFSFGPDGRFFVADVGQSKWEEVSVVERGGNYGWNVREGANCFRAADCPTETPDGAPLRDPIVQYPHDGGEVSGISVIGGYLYDGENVPPLRGRYVFADWRARGTLFVATDRGDQRWPVTAVPVDGDGLGSNVLSFGETPAGELLVCTTNEQGVTGETGAVHLLRSA